MWGFHDFLRQKSSSLFMLLGWSSVPVASIMILSIYLGLVKRILVFWSWVRYPKLMSSPATSASFEWSPIVILHSSVSIEWPLCSVRHDRTQRCYCISTVSAILGRSWLDKGRWNFSPGGRPNQLVMCPKGILLMWYIEQEGEWVRTLAGRSSRKWRAQRICQSIQPFCLKLFLTMAPPCDVTSV